VAWACFAVAPSDIPPPAESARGRRELQNVVCYLILASLDCCVGTAEKPSLTLRASDRSTSKHAIWSLDVMGPSSYLMERFDCRLDGQQE
jgi:hypothetical protein